MCRNIVTHCLECKEYIDSVLQACPKHGEITLDNGQNYGWCPVKESLDGYAINPVNGLPFDPATLLEDLKLHEILELRTLCVWCADQHPADMEVKQRENLYRGCSDLYAMTFDVNGNIQKEDIDTRWELRLGGGGNEDKVYYALWHERRQFEAQVVEDRKERAAKVKIPSHLMTPSWEFPFHESKVRNNPPACSIKDIQVRLFRQCPLRKLAPQSLPPETTAWPTPRVTPLKRKVDNVEDEDYIEVGARTTKRQKDEQLEPPIDSGYGSATLRNGINDHELDNLGQPPTNNFPDLNSFEEPAMAMTRNQGGENSQDEDEVGPLPAVPPTSTSIPQQPPMPLFPLGSDFTWDTGLDLDSSFFEPSNVTSLDNIAPATASDMATNLGGVASNNIMVIRPGKPNKGKNPMRDPPINKDHTTTPKALHNGALHPRLGNLGQEDSFAGDDELEGAAVVSTRKPCDGAPQQEEGAGPSNAMPPLFNTAPQMPLAAPTQFGDDLAGNMQYPTLGFNLFDPTFDTQPDWFQSEPSSMEPPSFLGRSTTAEAVMPAQDVNTIDSQPYFDVPDEYLQNPEEVDLNFEDWLDMEDKEE